MIEEWRPSLEYPKYEVSTWGRVRSIKKGIILKQAKDPKGYLTVFVSNGFRSNRKSVSNLVMLTFNPHWRKDKKTVISYRDGNKENVSFENLYYRDCSSMIKNTWDQGKYRIRKGAFKFDSITGKLARAKRGKLCGY